MTVVRAASADDAAAIARLHVRAWEAAYRGLIPDAVLAELSVERTEARWRMTLSSDGTLVAERDGELVGFLLQTHQGRSGEIASIYVDPPRWRTGIGGALMTAALDLLRERGCDAATLWVLAGNDRARAFYARHRFQPDGGKRPHERSGLQTVRLRRSLEQPAGPAATRPRSRSA